MIDLRAPIARMLHYVARLLDDRPARASKITRGKPRPPERPCDVEGTALLAMPDIMTYFDKESVDRMAMRAREARDKKPRPPERPWWEVLPRGNVEGSVLPGDRNVPIRDFGPLYDAALGMPDILTYIDKESFDRLARQAREARDKKSDED